MDPPKKPVILSETIFEQLNVILLELERNDEVSVVIITGTDKAFAVGADISKLNSMNVKKSVFDDNMKNN